MAVGDRVIVSSGMGSRAGILQYIGETKFAPGNWCGVQLDEPSGKNDGTVDDVQYVIDAFQLTEFRCLIFFFNFFFSQIFCVSAKLWNIRSIGQSIVVAFIAKITHVQSRFERIAHIGRNTWQYCVDGHVAFTNERSGTAHHNL